jgi:hypothetical protein
VPPSTTHDATSASAIAATIAGQSRRRIRSRTTTVMPAGGHQTAASPIGVTSFQTSMLIPKNVSATRATSRGVTRAALAAWTGLGAGILTRTSVLTRPRSASG